MVFEQLTSWLPPKPTSKPAGSKSPNSPSYCTNNEPLMLSIGSSQPPGVTSPIAPVQFLRAQAFSAVTNRSVDNKIVLLTDPFSIEGDRGYRHKRGDRMRLGRGTGPQRYNAYVSTPEASGLKQSTGAIGNRAGAVEVSADPAPDQGTYIPTPDAAN